MAFDRSEYPPHTNKPRNAEEWRALAVKSHLCIQCLKSQPEIWNGPCPFCGAADSREFMPSNAELKRAAQLILLQRAGRISRLKFHPRFDLKVNGIKVTTYEADAEYLENGKVIIEDTKSEGDFIEPVAKLKIALFDAIYQKLGYKVRIYRGTN